MSSEVIMLTHILSTLYVVAGIVGNVAYVPTIRDLWLLKPAANLPSYILWSLTSMLVFAYAAAVNGDLLFIALSCQTLCLCVAVVVLELRRRRWQKRNG
jgi:hypothetical protein